MSEAQLHKSVCDLLAAVLTDRSFFTTFPADGATRRGRIGLKRGVPDILIIHNGIARWIELKTATGKLSLDQRATIPTIERAGSAVFVCRSVEDVLESLDRWSIPLRPHKLVA